MAMVIDLAAPRSLDRSQSIAAILVSQALVLIV